MKIQLIRIDDRLIHGQVVLGWANSLQTKKIILCDDSVCENDWEKELYLSSVPEHLTPIVFSVRETAGYLNNRANNHANTILLVNSPNVIAELIRLGVSIEDVNVGGIHFKDGRKEYLPYLYLSDEEVTDFVRLMKKGVNFECLDVPEGRPFALTDVLENSH